MLLHEVTATNFIRSTVLMSKVFWKSSPTELFFSLHCLAPQLKHTWKISCLFTCVVTAFLRAGNPCNLYEKNFYHILRLKQSYLWGTQVDWCCVSILTLLLSFVATKKPLIHFFRCCFMFIRRFTHDSIQCTQNFYIPWFASCFIHGLIHCFIEDLVSFCHVIVWSDRPVENSPERDCCW